MERRLLLAIVLTFVVLTVYQWVVVPPPAVSPDGTPPAVGAQPSATTPETAVPPAGQTAGQPPPATAAPPVAAVQADTAERTVSIDNGLVRAEFSNRGATLTGWALHRYQAPDGTAVDLVPAELPPNAARPLSIRLDDAAKSRRVNEALFQTSVEGTEPSATLDARTTPVAVTFTYEDAAGLRVRKQFRVEPHSYILGVAIEVTDGGGAVNPFVQWGPGLGDVIAGNGGSMFLPVRKAEAIFATDGDVERVQAADLTAAPRYQGSYDFAGVDTHYFIWTAINPGSATLEYRPLSLPAADPAAGTRDYVGYDIRFDNADGGPTEARFFLGPKHFETLRQVDPELVRAVWFGMFAFLSVPLLSALNWVNGFVGNYGWSIIVLTFIINAAMFPLRHKSNVSMRKMQEIQPQVKAIQDRYAKLKITDPARQKMNTEMMELYRQKGVNPASGCVPMLLTLPVLFAFYSLLSEAIELRGAPFILWIHDLAAADPYYVTPILMGASQVVQQKLTPMAGADPVQQKMMMFMPVLFTFLFLTSPAGLALYWFASNVLIILQQVLTNRLIGPPPARPKAPAPKPKLEPVKP